MLRPVALTLPGGWGNLPPLGRFRLTGKGLGRIDAG